MRTIRCLGFRLLLGLAASGLLTPGSVHPQEVTKEGVRDLLVRIGGPVHIGPLDSAWTIGVINDSAVIEGRIGEGLVVVNGTARLSGSVGGSVVIVGGHIDLAPGARIGRDLVLYRSTVTRAEGAVIGGETIDEAGFSFGRRFLVFAWIGFTVALTAAAALFAGIGGGLLDRGATALRKAPGLAAAGTVVTFIGLPFVAFLALVTMIGAPLGLGILVILLPALWVLGYLVAATWFGRLLLPLLKAHESPGRPYAAATLGVIAAQLVGLIPVIGGLLALGAGALGAGVLASLAWHDWNRPFPSGMIPAPAERPAS